MAKEYIEREVLTEAIRNTQTDLKKFTQYDRYDGAAWREIELLVIISSMRAADVAEVVHCKNCRYWDGYNHSGRCEAPVNGLVRENTSANDFCSYGERKGDVENA